jgi:hypothetical protein
VIPRKSPDCPRGETCGRCHLQPRTRTHRWCKACQNANKRTWRAKQRIGRVGRRVRSTPPGRGTGDQQRVPDSCTLVALIPKHRAESVGIQILRFGSRWAVDIRIGYRRRNCGVFPTRKGVMFAARLLPRVLAELQRAQEMISGQAVTRGVRGALTPAGFNPELWRRQYLE